VVFLGKVKNPIEPLLISDLLVLPSETESFGLVALDAFAAGVPVISTDVGGLPEVNLHGKTGMLRPVGDVEGMADDALHVLDSDQFPSFHKAALQRAEAFHIHKILPQYEALYRMALATPSS
jgi:glycosyltransferase involved in cell wall biosynthesis